MDAVALDAYDGIGAATATDADRFNDLRSGVNAGGWTAVAPDPVNGQAFAGYGLDWLRVDGVTVHRPGGAPGPRHFVAMPARWA